MHTILRIGPLNYVPEQVAPAPAAAPLADSVAALQPASAPAILGPTQTTAQGISEAPPPPPPPSLPSPPVSSAAGGAVALAEMLLEQQRLTHAQEATVRESAAREAAEAEAARASAESARLREELEQLRAANGKRGNDEAGGSDVPPSKRRSAQR